MILPGKSNQIPYTSYPTPQTPPPCYTTTMTQTKPRLYIEGRGFVCSGCYRRLVLTPILLKAELMASKSALIATNREEVDSNGR